METTQLIALSYLEGDEYLKEKQRLEQSGTDMAALASAFKDDSNWRYRTQAAILKGWSDHRDLYNTVTGKITGVDPDAYKGTMTGIEKLWDVFSAAAMNEYKKDILPLCWEVILKFGSSMPDWQVITYLSMITAVPDEGSIQPLIHFIAITTDTDLKQRGINALGFMPKDAAKTAVEAELKRHKGLVPSLDDALFEINQEE